MGNTRDFRAPELTFTATEVALAAINWAIDNGKSITLVEDQREAMSEVAVEGPFTTEDITLIRATAGEIVGALVASGMQARIKRERTEESDNG